MSLRDGPDLNLFRNFDYELLKGSSFKEDSVREELVKPLLTALGYTANKPNQIHRSVTLRDPWLKTGSSKRKLTYYPDYLLEVDARNAWVMDAKAPQESVLDEDHVGQVYGYARHHEIKVGRSGAGRGEFVTRTAAIRLCGRGATEDHYRIPEADSEAAPWHSRLLYEASSQRCSGLHPHVHQAGRCGLRSFWRRRGDCDRSSYDRSSWNSP